MAGATPRKRMAAEQRRERIVAAALEAFGERGYQATAVDSVARAAGITPPVLYDHFASKRELYVELLQSQTDELIARVGAAVAAANDDESRLRASFDAFFEFVAESPFAGRMIAGSQSDDPEIVAAERRRDEHSRRGIAALLGAQSGLYEGEPDRDLRLEQVAQFIRHGLNGLAAWWREQPDTPRAVLVDRAMDVAWNGLARGPAAAGYQNEADSRTPSASSCSIGFE